MQKQTFIQEIRGSFILRKPSSRKPTNVYFLVRLDKIQYRFSLGLKIYPKHWIKKKNEAKISPHLSKNDIDNNTILNEEIISFKQRFLDYKTYLCQHPSEYDNALGLLRKYIYKGKEAMAKKNVKKENMALKILLYLKKSIIEDGNITGDGIKRTGSKGTYLSQLGWVETYIKEKGIEIYEYKDINSKFIKGFQKWLEVQKTERLRKPLTRTRINQVINNFLQRLNKYAVKEGLMKRTDFLNIAFEKLPNKAKSAKTSVILRDDEIIKLFYCKLSNENDNIIRDIFVLNCLLGQRFSDLCEVGKHIEEVSGHKVFTIPQKKGRKAISFTILFKMAMFILEKYNYNIPNISITKIDSKIKEIARIAGISGDKGGYIHPTNKEATYYEQPKYECITSHTARRTFVSLLAVRGFSALQIMKYTGHSDIRMVERYSKIDPLTIEIFNDNKKNNPKQILKLLADEEKSQRRKK